MSCVKGCYVVREWHRVGRVTGWASHQGEVIPPKLEDHTLHLPLYLNIRITARVGTQKGHGDHDIMPAFPQ